MHLAIKIGGTHFSLFLLHGIESKLIFLLHECHDFNEEINLALNIKLFKSTYNMSKLCNIAECAEYHEIQYGRADAIHHGRNIFEIQIIAGR